MNKIIIKNADGTVGITSLAPDAVFYNPSTETYRQATLDDVISRLPAGTVYEVVPTTSIPSDRTFRDAWEHSLTTPIVTNVTKAKVITHDKRRVKRASEFAPLDIQATIPAQAAAAETARAAIRDKYAVMQVAIDACTTEADLKALITREGL